MIGEGTFREDLLYRINTIQIEIPPLRERGGDILLLADFFFNRYTAKYNRPELRLDERAKEKLLAYPWPGNVRELQHNIERAVILCEQDTVKATTSLCKIPGQVSPRTQRISNKSNVR